MPHFPSDAWVLEFCRVLAAHPQAGETARALRGRYRFLVEPAGDLKEPHSYDIDITPDGDGAAVVPAPPNGAEPRLTIAAGYDRWVQLLTGELDLPIALMLRRIRLSGDTKAVTSQLDKTRPLLDSLSAVDSTFSR